MGKTLKELFDFYVGSQERDTSTSHETVRVNYDDFLALRRMAADALDAKDAEIADWKRHAREQDSCHACPVCHSVNVEQTHPAGADDFGAFKCHDCGHQGEIGEDFPSGTELRARIARLEAVVERLPKDANGDPVIPMVDRLRHPCTHHVLVCWANGNCAAIHNAKLGTWRVEDCYLDRKPAAQAAASGGGA